MTSDDRFGQDTPWPLDEIVRRLADAADHLLLGHDCDTHGHEGIALARDAARAWLAREPGVGQPDFRDWAGDILSQGEDRRLDVAIADHLRRAYENGRAAAEGERDEAIRQRRYDQTSYAEGVRYLEAKCATEREARLQAERELAATTKAAQDGDG